MVSRFLIIQISVLCLVPEDLRAEAPDRWAIPSSKQYHVQTDEGPERFFRFQTLNGQYRNEKRLEDGTVIGTEAWLDPLGYLRLKDYIADHQGFRILRSKMVYIGKDTPMEDAINDIRRTGVVSKPKRPPNPFRSQHKYHEFTSNPNSIPTRNYYSGINVKPTVVDPRPIVNTKPSVDSIGVHDRPNISPVPLNSNAINSGAVHTLPPISRNVNSIPVNRRPINAGNVNLAPARNPGNINREIVEYPEYTGVHNTPNGFEYYLKRQYHEEETENSGDRVGSFGYIDPFGIRRVTYYKTDDTGGFTHRKNNRFVGFQAKPYDSLAKF